MAIYRDNSKRVQSLSWVGQGQKNAGAASTAAAAAAAPVDLRLQRHLPAA